MPYHGSQLRKGKDMKALKIAGIVVGSLVLLLAIVAGVMLLLLRQPTGIAKQITPVATSPEAAQQLDTKWDSFQSTAQQAAPGAVVSVTLTQEEVASKVAQELPTVKMPKNVGVSDVNVNLVDGKILASGTVSYSGIRANVGMEATIETENGEPVIVLQNLDLGKLPVPQSVKDQIRNIIPDNGKISLSNLPADINNVQVVNGEIVISGVRK